MIVRMHHFGMMTDDLEKSVKSFESMGFKIYKRFTMPGIKAAMLKKDGAGIEFFEFENPKGEFESKIKRHTAFVSDDLEKDVEKFVSSGYEITVPIAEGLIVKRRAFVADKSGNSIELLEPYDD